VLFEYDPVLYAYTQKHEFDSLTGSNPEGSLMQASNGKLYGMTSKGGVNDDGVIFEYDLVTNAYTTKFDFDNLVTGRVPFGSLIESSNGKFYGMTSAGGAQDRGVLFEYDPTINVYTQKLNFRGFTNGNGPFGSLIEAANGKLYGLTSEGGANNMGVLFEYEPATNTYAKKIDFNGTLKGRNPKGSLLEASNGVLYGMTSAGGSFDDGVIFSYDISTNIFSTTVVFGFLNKGKTPYGNLIEVTTPVVGIEEQNTESIAIYPNPTTGIFNISFGKVNSEVVYTISSLEGKIVKTGKTSLNNLSIDLSKESKGVYFIRVNNKETSTVYKLVKQ